jgi:hypothetical protein
MLKNIFIYLIHLLISFVVCYLILSLIFWDLYPLSYFSTGGLVVYRVICFIISIFLFGMEMDGNIELGDNLWKKLMSEIENRKHKIKNSE